eukprot:CAMPEP_0113516858 /NCGR_PEP_ID=MMETSP0014_2-20120614/41876_1 /TAXON_ID=2857 /ORGANISM="Nitzschia sp." /LENGTH=885 /DNA_ID=CAMNT_0000413869 /DNA_START=118 /DNA_END=2775 /DNA_ORIENTATION=- /assembly_acc=CAM_ASM_000159
MDKKSFVEQHAAVVLKLKIKAADGTTQIRRVKVDRLASDDDGEISFDIMRKLSVQFYFGDRAVTNYDDCVVSLTYYDSDNDMVSIGSKEELMDAIEQFSDATPPVLRITSYVNPSSSSTNTSGGVAAAAAAAAATTTTTGSSQSTSGSDRTTDRGTSTRGDVPGRVPAPLVVHGVPVQKVLESFVGVLSTAVHHLQEGLTTTDPPHQSIGGSRTVMTGAVPGSPPTTTETSGVTADVDAGRTASFTTETTGSVEPSSETEIELTAAASAAANEDGNEEDTKKEDTKKKAATAAPGTSNKSPSKTTGVETQESRLFIHGRHTCDSCLSTPIIGKRYHSINLPDYDLCENCHNNYKGSDIQFEPVELDRDRPFQERWHRRHSRNLSLRMMRASTRHSRCGAGGRNRNGPRGFATRSESSGIPVRGGRACRRHPMTGGLRRHQFVAPLKPAPQYSGNAGPNPPVESASDVKTPVPSAPPANRTESEFDTALKEAIRRSLSDIAPKQAAIISDSKKAADEDTAGEDAHTGNANDLQLKEENADAVEETRPGKDGEDKEESTSVTKTGSDIPRSVEVRKSDLSDLHSENTKDDTSYADAVMDNADSPSQVSRWSTELEKLRALGYKDDAVARALNNAMENAVDSASVDSEKLADQEDVSEEISKHQSNDKESPVSSRSLKIDQSFSSDAVGNGDVAEAIGATLDMVVGQISAMLDDQEDPKTGDNEVSSPGEIIVDPDHPPTDGDQNETDGDWSVVKSVVSTGSNGTTEEEQIARAATMLGSALFNSDMKNSVENVSSKMSAPGDSRSVSSFSVPSSVPTDVGTNNSVSPSQLARWCTELEKLCALGFEEEKCVEILERLSAANIGVDSEDDEISLELVVNKLLEEQMKK